MGLDMVEFILAVEEEFDVAITDDEWYELTTSHKVAEYISKLDKSSKDINKEEIILERVMEIAMEQFGVTTERLQAHTDFIKDLKID